jgi:hypothetical protein
MRANNPLGHLTNLMSKDKRETSMLGKQLSVKICSVKCCKSCVHEVPQGIEAKPGLAEP